MIGCPSDEHRFIGVCACAIGQGNATKEHRVNGVRQGGNFAGLQVAKGGIFVKERVFGLAIFQLHKGKRGWRITDWAQIIGHMARA